MSILDFLFSKKKQEEIDLEKVRDLGILNEAEYLALLSSRAEKRYEDYIEKNKKRKK